MLGSGIRPLDPVSAAWTRYDLIAREGTVDRARSMLSQAGLLPTEQPR